MKILAIDLGKFKGTACVYDCSTGEHSFVTIATKPSAIHDLLTMHHPQRVVVEIGSAAGWVHDLALTMGLEIQVANPNHDAWRWKQRQAQDRQRRCSQARPFIGDEPTPDAPTSLGRSSPMAVVDRRSYHPGGSADGDQKPYPLRPRPPGDRLAGR